MVGVARCVADLIGDGLQSHGRAAGGEAWPLAALAAIGSHQPFVGAGHVAVVGDVLVVDDGRGGAGGHGGGVGGALARARSPQSGESVLDFHMEVGQGSGEEKQKVESRKLRMPGGGFGGQGPPHTSPGQRPGGEGSRSFCRLKACFIMGGVQRWMRQAFSLRAPLPAKPRAAAAQAALPWASMNEAVGLTERPPPPSLKLRRAGLSFMIWLGMLMVRWNKGGRRVWHRRPGCRR